MALNIKDARTDRLARELAQLTGQSIIEAVAQALEEKLQTERRRRGKQMNREALRKIVERSPMSAVPTKYSAMTSTACLGDRRRYLGSVGGRIRRTRCQSFSDSDRLGCRLPYVCRIVRRGEYCDRSPTW